jgi:hypothetical protein
MLHDIWSTNYGLLSSRFLLGWSITAEASPWTQPEEWHGIIWAILISNPLLTSESQEQEQTAPPKCARSAAYPFSCCHSALRHAASSPSRPPPRHSHGRASTPGAGRRPVTSALGARTVPAPTTPTRRPRPKLTPARRWWRWGRSCCPPPILSPRRGSPTPPSPGGRQGSPWVRPRPPTTPRDRTSPSW